MKKSPTKHVSYTALKVSVFGIILVRIFPAFGLNTERYGVIGSISPYSVRMRENAGKMRIRITPNTDSLYAVLVSLAFLVNFDIRLISMLHSK